MSDEGLKDDCVTDTGIGFVFDAFSDNFKIIDSRVENIEESMYKLSSKIEALDLGMVYSVELYEKKMDAIIRAASARDKDIGKRFNMFRNAIFFIASFSFLLNVALLVYIAGA
jgi:hypothetical protein